ncbi:MAG: hypothetical protein RJA36_667, partial [Pseudomonadota bacterium]
MSVTSRGAEVEVGDLLVAVGDVEQPAF